MKLINRVIVYLTQNMKKTILLFLVIFVIGNILGSAIIISQSSKKMKQIFLNNIGAKIKVEHRMKYDEILNQYNAGDPKYQKFNKFFSDSLHGLDCVYSNNTYLLNGLQASDLDYVIEGKGYREDYHDYLNIHSAGISNRELEGIYTNNIHLMSGRTFSDFEMENGEKVVIVNSNLKKKTEYGYQDIRVGDLIQFELNIYPEYTQSTQKNERVDSKKESYQVIGIYERNENVRKNDSYSFDNPLTYVYMPEKQMKNIEQEFKELNHRNGNLNDKNNQMLLASVFYQLKNPNDMQKLVNQLEFDLEQHKIKEMISIYSSAETYGKISAPIDSISKIGTSLAIITTILALLVCSAVVGFFTYSRRYEIGILLALGEKQVRIMIQIILELVLVSVLAIGCSLLTSKQLGKTYSEIVIQNQVDSQISSLSIEEQKQQLSLIELYDFEINNTEIIQISGSLMIIIMISSIIPLIVVNKIKPKKLLE